MIPLNLILAFYVAQVVSRWWAQWNVSTNDVISWSSSIHPVGNTVARRGGFPDERLLSRGGGEQQAGAADRHQADRPHHHRAPQAHLSQGEEEVPHLLSPGGGRGDDSVGAEGSGESPDDDWLPLLLDTNHLGQQHHTASRQPGIHQGR